MKILKIKTFSTLSIVSIALLFSACDKAGNSTANSSTANAASQANTATVVNSNQTRLNSTPPVSNTAPSPTASKAEGDRIQGELQVGKSESVILYVGKETGDYAGYCFTNDSEGGRAILAACKDKEQCEVVGTVDYDSGCKVPGLEADLSASGKIVKVASVKSVGRSK
jgi:hypothetical protein